MSERKKINYDAGLLSSVLRKGDRVLVKNRSERGGPGKLRSYWEPDIHIVVRRVRDSPVYEVRREDGRGDTRTLHRNMLMQCESLPVMEKSQEKRIRVRKKGRTKITLPDKDSSSDDEYETVLRHSFLDPLADVCAPQTSVGSNEEVSSES